MNWINVKTRIPESEDDSVLVYLSQNKSIDLVHIQDYFDNITAGKDEHGKQLYTKWYITCGITHWMYLPDPPEQIN